MCGFIDFLAVRKIPLKEHPAFAEDGSPRPVDEDGAEDPAVDSALQRIRKVTLKDRSLYDKVCCGNNVIIPIVFVKVVSCITGCEGVRIFCPSVLKARSIVYFSDKRPRSGRGGQDFWAAALAANARTQGRQPRRMAGC